MSFMSTPIVAKKRDNRRLKTNTISFYETPDYEAGHPIFFEALVTNTMSDNPSHH